MISSHLLAKVSPSSALLHFPFLIIRKWRSAKFDVNLVIFESFCVQLHLLGLFAIGRGPATSILPPRPKFHFWGICHLAPQCSSRPLQISGWPLRLRQAGYQTIQPVYDAMISQQEFLQAARFGKYERVESLLNSISPREKSKVINALSDDGLAPLHFAARYKLHMLMKICNIQCTEVIGSFGWK